MGDEGSGGTGTEDGCEHEGNAPGAGVDHGLADAR
jgi:hypothetical protein